MSLRWSLIWHTATVQRTDVIATTMVSIRSYPYVAERHYPDLFKQYFPAGIPAQQTGTHALYVE